MWGDGGPKTRNCVPHLLQPVVILLRDAFLLVRCDTCPGNRCNPKGLMRHVLSTLSVFCFLAILATGAVARADVSYSYSYFGPGISGSGDFTLTGTSTDGVYEVTSMDGQVNGTNITGLLSVNSYKGNDNLLYDTDTYLDGSGVSFLLDNAANVNIFYSNGDWFLQGDGNFVLDGGSDGSGLTPHASGPTTLELTSFTFRPQGVAATPEPSSILLLGTGILVAAGMMRIRLVRP